MEAQIILINGKPEEQAVSLLQKKGFTILDQTEFHENANDQSFNDSKFLGTVAANLNKTNVAIVNGENCITKKNQLSLNYVFTAKLKKKPTQIKITILSEDQTGKLYEWAKQNGAEICNREELEKMEPVENKLNASLKFTCGLTCEFTLNSQLIKGHRTCAFNITEEEVNKIKTDCEKYFGQKFKGYNIALTVTNVPGGSVISIPELGKNAHVTNNTTIRSVLSGPVVEKYENNVMTFNLSDIDPKVKKDSKLEIKMSEECDVIVTGFYLYALDQ